MEPLDLIRRKFDVLRSVLDERQQRLWAAAEAEALGRGGQATITEATGIHGPRIRAGLRELEELRRNPPDLPPRQQRIRRSGAGRKSLVATDATLLHDLDVLIEPDTRGDPECPLRWTSKSLVRLAAELQRQDHKVSPSSVGNLLREAGYSLQAPSKTKEGKQHEDRDAQFRHISAQVRKLQRAGQPVISVDAKKKELIGDFYNKGVEWRPTGTPERVRVHDFIDKELGKAVPYGVYDLAREEGWVSIGVDRDTAEFAVESIARWWRNMGRRVYPNAKELLITADSGGSNSTRSRLWKLELQRLADLTGLHLHVAHYPPGTSKWNKIEHRLFSHITQNWRGRPLESIQTVVQLVAATTTRTGLRVRARLDNNRYPKGIEVTDAELASVNLTRSKFHGDWNYTVSPH